MASWHPDPQSLNTLYQLIVNSKSVDSNTRIEAAQVTPLTSPLQPNPIHSFPLLIRVLPATRPSANSPQLYKLSRLYICLCNRPDCRSTFHSRTCSKK